MPALPFAAVADGLQLAVRLTPKAAAARVQGLIEDGKGGVALKATVTAPAEGGKANEALLSLLAETLGLKRRDLAIVLGHADRRKLLHIAGDPVSLAARITERLEPWLKRE